LRIGLAGEPTTLDPHAVNIAPNNALAWHLFEALTHVDAQTRLTPGLALSWQAISPTEWEFRLRQGVRFHDGSAFDAEDVVASIERARRLPNGQFGAFVQRISTLRIVDPYTLRISTSQPHAALPLDLDSIFIISRRHAMASSDAFDRGEAAVGTGPWRLRRFSRGERVELDRNDAFHGTLPEWPAVELRVYGAERARMAALLGGDVDLIESVPGADLVRLRGNPRFAIEQAVSWRTLFFHADERLAAHAAAASNPLADRRVRQALSLAIDRRAIVERLLDGAGRPAGNLVAPGVFGHDETLSVPRFDPALARQLLAEAGYPGGFELTLAAPNNRYPGDARIAQAVAAMFARIGVRARLVTLPVNVYLPRARRGEFALAMLGWGSFSADLALRSLVATRDPARGNGGWNWSYYSSPEVDRLLDTAAAEFDPDRRESLVRTAMRHAMRDGAVIPLHHTMASWAMRRELRYTARTDEFTFAHEVHAAPDRR
jgi:peptide/nickel transport system substrate-binding protein